MLTLIYAAEHTTKSPCCCLFLILPLVLRWESPEFTKPARHNGSLLLRCLYPSVCVSEVELLGQEKPPILCWKEMIIYHLVIHGDKVTGETGGGRSVEWRVKKGERRLPNLQMLHIGVNFSVLKLCCPQDTGYDEQMGGWIRSLWHSSSVTLPCTGALWPNWCRWQITASSDSHIYSMLLNLKAF